MSGWVDVEYGSIRLRHLSTSSLIMINIEEREEEKQGVFTKTSRSFFIDYSQFNDLKNAIDKVKILSE